MLFEEANASGLASRASSSLEGVSVVASEVLVQATPCSDLSNVNLDEESCVQMSLICGLIQQPQTQQPSQPKQSATSKSPSQPDPSGPDTRVSGIELEESMLYAETPFSADLSRGQESQSACRSSPRRNRPFASVQPLFSDSATDANPQPSSAVLSSRQAVFALRESTCPAHQNDNENAPPTRPPSFSSHNNQNSSSQKENDPSSCEPLLVQESARLYSTAILPATRRALATSTVDHSPVPSDTPDRALYTTGNYLGERLSPSAPARAAPELSAPIPVPLVKTSKAAPNRPQPRLKPLNRSINPNTPGNAPASPAQHVEATAAAPAVYDRFLGHQTATTAPQQHFILEATQLEDLLNPIEPRLQSPDELDMPPRDNTHAGTSSSRRYAVAMRPTPPRNGQRSPPRRAPTTPTTALRPTTATVGRPVDLPSDDSFTRPTAAEERERWLRSTDAEVLNVSVGRLAGVIGFETDNGADAAPARRLLQNRVVRTPSPRRRGPMTPKTSPVGQASSDKSPKAQRPLYGLASPMHSPAPQQQQHRGRPISRHALRERNNVQNDGHNVFDAGPSSRVPISAGRRPPFQPHTSGGNKGRGRKDGQKGQRGDDAGSEEESLHSQMSQMSVGSPPPPAHKSHSRSRHHRQHPEAENVLVVHTPTNSSGSVGGGSGLGQPSRPPPTGSRRTTGFDLDAPLQLTDSQKSKASSATSNPIPPAAQPMPVPRRLRSPSPISYVTNSSGDHQSIPMEDIFKPLTPPNPISNRGHGNDGFELTPTQPSEITDSQHPAVIAAKARFTGLARGSAATTGVPELYVPAEAPRLPPPRTIVADRGGPAARLGRRLDFGAGPGAAVRTSVPGPSGAGRPKVLPLAAAPPFLERIARKPAGPPGQHQRMTSGPKIFPPARAKPPSYAQPANETTIMDVDVNEIVSATPDDPIVSSSSPRRDLKGKGKAVDVAPGKRHAVIQAPTSHNQQPPSTKRRFQELEEDAEEVELPLEIDFTIATQQAQVVARKKLSDQKSSPAVPLAQRRTVTNPPRSPRSPTRRGAPTSTGKSPRQYTSHAKLERDSARKRRRQEEKDEATSEEEAEIEVNQSGAVTISEVDPKSPVKAKATGKRARSLSTRPPDSTKLSAPTKHIVKKRKVSSIQRDFADFPASRVFARWTKNKFYYPGIVIARSERMSNKFTVRFDDDTQADVDVSKIRLGMLQVGDVVQIVDRWRETGVVRDVSEWTARDGWAVEIAMKDKDGDEEQILCEGKKLRIPEKEINRQWDDRAMGIDNVEINSEGSTGVEEPVDEPEDIASPKPSTNPTRSAARRRSSTRGPSVAVVPRSASRRHSGHGAVGGDGKGGVFSSIAFVITMHPSGKSDGSTDRDKERLCHDIIQGGGTVYDNWDSLYSIQGKDGVTGRKDVRWIGPRRGVNTVLLLADQPTQTAKYLMALALGVPCVASAWIRDCAAGLDFSWRSYLLAAGRSEYLGAEVSQLFDQAWSTDEELLHDVFRSQIVRRPWWDLRVLCIFPSVRRKSGDPQATQRYPQMMVAMGAESVEVVTAVKNASNVIAAYDYIVVTDDHLTGMRKDLKASGAKEIGGVIWFKQCLITGLALAPA
ncbi:hypothetical protein FRB93_005993 [Tulasnella sp. JGI-2019a]|nr:hypothetical protein FRB93_005993 [Tulasnella sp. JGI-2019a]